MDEKAAKILAEQYFCVIATASRDAEPWASPVFFNYDSHYRFVWESSRDARHSQLIVVNPAVAIVVANFNRPEADEAVYLDCRAREVPEERLAEALEAFTAGAHPRKSEATRTIDLYKGDRPLRLYEAVPERAYLLSVSYDTDGHRLDHREEIEIARR